MARWDPDGPGPLAEQVVLGGSFTLVGDAPARRIASWNPQTGTFSALGSGFDDAVTSIALLPNGDLLAAGAFVTAGAVAANRVARWNGSQWAQFGAGLADPVLAMAVHTSGTVAVATVGGTVWLSSGSTWTQLPSGTTQFVSSLAWMSNGQLVVAGGRASTPALDHLARWDGASWLSFSPAPNAYVSCLALTPNGHLVIGGDFTSVGTGLARFDGSTWSGYAPLPIPGIRAVAVAGNGDVIVGGQFVFSPQGTAIGNAARWNGSSWNALSADSVAPPVSRLIEVNNGDLLLAGSFREDFLDRGARYVARSSSSGWQAITSGTNAQHVSSLGRLPDGRVFGVGEFVFAGLPRQSVAIRQGSSWAPFAPTLPPSASRVYALTDGRLLAFVSPALLEYDGSGWVPTGLTGQVDQLLELPDGSYAVNGTNLSYPGRSAQTLVIRVAGGWTFVPALQGPRGPVPITVLCTTPAGGFVASIPLGLVGGVYVQLGFWNGTSWFPFGLGSSHVSVAAAHALRDGSIVFAGSFSQVGGVAVANVARWNAGTWSAMGAGFDREVTTLDTLPNGDLCASGSFTRSGSAFVDGLARWDGVAWSPVANGTGGLARSFATDGSGALAMAGAFTSVAGRAALGYAELSTPCAPTQSLFALGCGAASIRTDFAWTGGRWEARASGLPTSAVVFAVVGFAPASIAVQGLFPQASPACTLHVSPDVLVMQVIARGTATMSLDVLDSPALTGLVFHHQVVAVELGGAGLVVATPAVRAVVGSF